MAGYESGQGIDITLTASGNMDSNQYKFVKLATTAGRFDVSTGASGPAPIGVLQDDPRTLDAGKIRVHGITQLWIDGATAVAYADFITSGSDGRGVVAETAGSNPYYGVALKAVASGSSLIPVLLMTGQAAADNTP
jgi:hypothetical protein